MTKGRSAKSGKPAQTRKGPIFTFPERDLALMRAEVAASRLRRSDQLIARLGAENVKLTPASYVARLRKSKAGFIKRASDLGKKYLEERAANAHLIARPLSHQSRGDGEGGRRRFGGFEGLPFAFDAIAYGVASGQQVAPACQSEQGYRLPISASKINVTGNSIRNGSTAAVDIDRALFSSHGITFVRAELDDHASVWRNDGADCFATGYEIIWDWNPVPCDMWLIYRVFGKQQGNFTNAADDGGACDASIMVANTDANGNFQTVSSASRTILFESRSSGSFVSDWVEFGKCVPINQGCGAAVAMAHFIWLSAQDGKVSMVLGCRAAAHAEDGLYPAIWFMLLPRGSGGCFISTSICRTLGKPDDCRELQLLRGFRDSYVRSLPHGDALIREYYAKAPGLLALIEASSEGKALLRDLYARYLRRCLSAIELRRHGDALAIYANMMAFLEARFRAPLGVA
jgi:hypothetical protein